MLKLNSLVLLSVLAAVGVSNAQANSPGGHEGNPSLTWEQFKEACLHPELFHQQVPPSNIRLQCTGIEREFVPSAPGQIPLPGNRKIVSAVFSNKYHVNAEANEDPVLGRVGSCLRFKEIEKIITVEKVISCDDAVSMKSSLGEYCASVVNLAKAGSAKLVDVRDTQRTVDTCGKDKDFFPSSN